MIKSLLNGTLSYTKIALKSVPIPRREQKQRALGSTSPLIH